MRPGMFLTSRPDRFTLDLNHPLAKGLVFAGLGAMAGGTHYHDSSIEGNHGTLQDDAAWMMSRSCRGIDYSLNDAANVQLARRIVFADTDVWSIGLWYSVAAIVDDKSWYCDKIAVTNSRLENRFTNRLRLYSSSGNVTADIYSSNPTGTHHHAMSYDGTNYTLFVDGEQTATTAKPDTSGFVIHLLGGVYDAVLDGWQGTQHSHMIFRRILSSGEIRQLADPSNVTLSGMIRETTWDWVPYVAAAPAGNVPTGHLYGPLVGPLGGPI